MITLRTIKTMSVVVILGLLAGCKIAVMVVEGGEVQVDPLFNPASTCSEGTICIHEINDTSYTQSFFAVPKPGWRFVKWSGGDNFLCSNNTSSVCEVTNAFLAGNDVAEEIVASPKTYYLMPLFEPLTTIGATVAMNGKAWAPMSGFGNLSWDDINAVCPATNGGHCLVGGKLMEYDMTGWTWASVDDVNALLNSYLGSGTIGPGPDSLPSSLVGLPLRQAGFPATAFQQSCGGCAAYTWKGWTSTVAGVPGQAHLAEVFFSVAITNFGGHATTLLTDDSSAGHSAWFYRTP
jgi:hypothetical protein